MVLRRVASLLVFAILPFGLHAQDPQLDQTIAVLVTSASGAPTADELVAYYHGPQIAPPPLQGLTVGNPEKIAYFLPIRAAGDALAHLNAHPDSVRAKLERYVVVHYPSGADLDAALSALRMDSYVLAAYRSFPMPPTASLSTSIDSNTRLLGGAQYGREAMNVDAAWQLTGGGYALISVIDSGIATQHRAFQQFGSDGRYLDGNYSPIDSFDISLAGLVDPPQNDPNADERRAMPVLNPACNPDPQNHPNMQPAIAGHGTHVAGLVAANPNVGLGVSGTCKHCAIGAWKTMWASCDSTTGTVSLSTNTIAQASALALSGNIGAQVASMSFGRAQDVPYPTYCQNQDNDPMCLAIKHSFLRDVAMVASSGNGRGDLDFPAAEPAVIAVGGFAQNLQLWDLWPNCPPAPYGDSECGSAFTLTLPNGAPQELVGSADAVLSTTYPGYNWNPVLHCGDQFPGPGFGNGVGLCTGTSMSAPEIAGLAGLLRSINPLVRTGDTPTQSGTIRHILATTTFEARSGQPWNRFTGYGRPDAAAAARTMLGTVAGATARNRATPLFRLYSAASHDYADVTAPQIAVAMMVNLANAYMPATLMDVPGYLSFPHDPADGPLATPQASVYVMTTEVAPRPEWPALVPLHLMDRDLPNGEVDDFMLVSTVPDIEYAHAHGYHLRNIVGYVFQPCTPEPTCIPPGAERFYRACNTTYGDCATFLESETATFTGYTSTFPPTAGTRTLLGYAYPAGDDDHDELPNAFELVVGTNPASDDSDGDHLKDAAEFPMFGVAVSDPCAGGFGARDCAADKLFANGFDG